MKKKNLLFVIPSLSAGGGEKSLVNLLSQINFNHYNVELFLLNHQGLFMEFLPKQVKVIPLPETYKLFTLPFWRAIQRLIFKGDLRLAFNRIKFTIKNRTIKNVSKSEQYTWKYIANSLGKLEKKYDVAIGFLEKTSTYFCVDKVEAKQKIGWVHIDYEKLGMDPNFDLVYFNQLNKIVTVSEECANIFINRFPSQKDKVEVIYNVVSPTMINNMSNQVLEHLDNKQDETTILTIGRLHYQKGLEMAIESCSKLIKKGFTIKWYVIGEGEEREKLSKLIADFGLEDTFILLGLRSNPYPFLKHADIYVQPSRFEGKSIALDEAKILNKPIVVTNFSTAKDQITNGIDGLIVDMNTDAIADGIEKLITDKQLRESLKDHLSRLKLGTEEEVDKFYKIL
jgi:glycosyltransferase involved in cell wall biosynthesis